MKHYCRHKLCKSKLPEPVENPHHAFCTRGCHSGFFRSRCLVCETPMQRKTEKQRFRSGHKVCERKYRKYPQKYDFPCGMARTPKGELIPPTNAHFTGLQTPPIVRPTVRCLRHWAWHRSDDLEHELRDATGTLLARLESNAGRHRLTHPRTFPIMAKLAEAKRNAEAVALGSLPLSGGVNIEARELAKITAANSSPNPMGPPLDRQLSREAAIPSDWKPSGYGIAPEIPDFLRRKGQ